MKIMLDICLEIRVLLSMLARSGNSNQSKSFGRIVQKLSLSQATTETVRSRIAERLSGSTYFRQTETPLYGAITKTCRQSLTDFLCQQKNVVSQSQVRASVTHNTRDLSITVSIDGLETDSRREPH